VFRRYHYIHQMRDIGVWPISLYTSDERYWCLADIIIYMYLYYLYIDNFLYCLAIMTVDLRLIYFQEVFSLVSVIYDNLRTES
jgi:hypothetical protein